MAKILTQQLAPLPDARVSTDCFPFEKVGCDFFGPFDCTIGRKKVKRYGCIFVCMSSRAIHLEVVNHLSTDAFICALMRFVSRRGPVKELFSDNGSNYIGADNELKRIIEDLDQSQITSFALSKGFQWHFHPPLAFEH